MPKKSLGHMWIVPYFLYQFQVTTELCAKCVKHVEKVEKSYFTHQELMDSEVRPFLVEEVIIFDIYYMYIYYIYYIY